MFKNIKEPTVLAVRNCIKQGLFRVDINTRKELLYSLHRSLCEVYNIQCITFIIQDDLGRPGFFNRNTKEIVINKPSLVTYLHEFCHYMRIHTHKSNSEDIARGWSISLYYLATPKLCTKAIESGKIIHQNKISEDN